MFNSTDKRNSIWYTSFFVISSVLNFVNYSLCFKSLDIEIFGLFIFLNSILQIGNSLDFGFGLSTIKHIAHSKTENDYEFIRSYYITFFLLYFILAFIISAAFLLYYYFFLSNSTFVRSTTGLNSFYIYLLLIISFFLNFMAGYLRCILEGLSDYINLSKISIFISISNTVLILILFFYDLNIYYLAFINLIVSLISFISTLIYVIFKYDFLKFDLNKIDFTIFKKFYKYGIKIHLSMFIGSFSDPLIKFLIGSYLSLSFITFYESSKKIINFSNGIIISAQRSLFVKISEYNALCKLNEFVNEKLFYYSKMSNYYSILIYGILNPFFCIFIFKWFNRYESILILIIFFMSYSLINFGGSLYNVIMVEGKGLSLIIIQLINIVSVFVFLILSLVLFKSYLGLIGFYFSTVISILLLVIYLKKNNEFDYKSYFVKVKFQDIIKLNIILVIELILLYSLEYFKYYILLIFFFVNIIIFWKYLLFFYRKAIFEFQKLYKLKY